MLAGAEIDLALGAQGASTRLVDLGQAPLVHAHPDHALDIVLVRLGRQGVSALPVVSRKDTTKLLGVISMRDVAAMARADGGQDGGQDG